MGEIQHNMIFKLVKEERTITNIARIREIQADFGGIK